MVTPNPKREAANVRLRRNFLAQLPGKLDELSSILEDNDGEEVIDVATQELIRLANTAQSLGMTEFHHTARVVALQIPDKRQQALSRLVNVVQQAIGKREIPAIAIVAEDAIVGQLASSLARFAEPTWVGSSIAQLLEEVSAQELGAALIPAKALNEVAELRKSRDCPIYIYGPARDLKTRIAAVKAGATGYLAEPVDFGLLIDIVRRDAPRATRDEPTVFILAPNHISVRLAKELDQRRVKVLTSDNPADIIPALDDLCPDSIVLAAKTGNEKAEDLVRVVRTHPRFRQTGVFVVGEISDTLGLLRAGADDVLAGEAWVLHAERIHARLARFRNWTWDLIPITGQLNRAGALRMVDKMTDNARRTKEPLSVGILVIRGLSDTQHQFGPAAGFVGLRRLSTALQMGLRTPDLIGHLNPEAFLVALPNCTIVNAEQRMKEIQADFHRRCQADKRLHLLSCLYGLADTELGLNGLVQRADTALQKNKGNA